MKTYDVSKEKDNFVFPGIQYKYEDTLIVFSSQKCLEICVYCFRKRFFNEGEILTEDTVAKVEHLKTVLKNNKNIKSILFTGGDALCADMNYIESMIDVIRQHDNIKSIRFGTRALVLQPEILGKTGIIEILKGLTKNIFFILHIVKPEDITFYLYKMVKKYKGDLTFYCQTPLLKGINNNSEILADLWQKAIDCSIKPYYLFQNRHVEGNNKYSVTLKEGIDVFLGAKSKIDGLTQTARYVMSTDIGKIEIVGEENNEIILRVLRSKENENNNKIMRVPSDTVWIDENNIYKA